jgi:hypothetical protein
MKRKSISQKRSNFKKTSHKKKDKPKDMALLTLKKETTENVMNHMLENEIITGYNIADYVPIRVESAIEAGKPVVTYAISKSEGVDIDDEISIAKKNFFNIVGGQKGKKGKQDEKIITTDRRSFYVWQDNWGEIPSHVKVFGTQRGSMKTIVEEKSKFLYIICDNQNELSNVLNFFKTNYVRYTSPPSETDPKLQKHADYQPYITVEIPDMKLLGGHINDFDKSTIIKFTIPQKEQKKDTETVVSVIVPDKRNKDLVIDTFTQSLLQPTPEFPQGRVLSKEKRDILSKEIATGDYPPEIIDHSVWNFVIPRKEKIVLSEEKGKKIWHGREFVRYKSQ